MNMKLKIAIILINDLQLIISTIIFNTSFKWSYFVSKVMINKIKPEKISK